MDYIIIGLILMWTAFLIYYSERREHSTRLNWDQFITDHQFVDEMEDKYESVLDLDDDAPLFFDDRRPA